LVLEPVLARYREREIDLYFRADAAFAKPELYELLEAEDIRYAIRLPANQVSQWRIGHLLTRPLGRPPKKPIVSYASFRYQANGWTQTRRVVAKVEWHQGGLYPRVGFIVTNLIRPNKRVVKFYNGRGTAEQHIKEGKNAIRWTRLSVTLSATTPCGSSSMPSRTTSPTLCARWPCRRRSSIGRSRH
jgi:hypothetical protein